MVDRSAERTLVQVLCQLLPPKASDASGLGSWSGHQGPQGLGQAAVQQRHVCGSSPEPIGQDPWLTPGNRVLSLRGQNKPWGSAVQGPPGPPPGGVRRRSPLWEQVLLQLPKVWDLYKLPPRVTGRAGMNAGLHRQWLGLGLGPGCAGL